MNISLNFFNKKPNFQEGWEDQDEKTVIMAKKWAKNSLSFLHPEIDNQTEQLAGCQGSRLQTESHINQHLNV